MKPTPRKPVKPGKKRRRTSSRAEIPALGWREWVALPDLGVKRIKAKLDTGARSSALHAYDIHLFQDEDRKWHAKFTLHPLQRNTSETLEAQCDVVEFRRVRSSNGQMEMRPVVRTTLRVGDRDFPIDLTLSRRDEMGFRLLLGRAALRNRFLVHSGRSFLAEKKRLRKRPHRGESVG